VACSRTLVNRVSASRNPCFHNSITVRNVIKIPVVHGRSQYCRLSGNIDADRCGVSKDSPSGGNCRARGFQYRAFPSVGSLSMAHAAMDVCHIESLSILSHKFVLVLIDSWTSISVSVSFRNLLLATYNTPKILILRQVRPMFINCPNHQRVVQPIPMACCRSQTFSNSSLATMTPKLEFVGLYHQHL
jgi:hypothetical protein